MNIIDALRKIERIFIPDGSPEVVETVYNEFKDIVPAIKKGPMNKNGRSGTGNFIIAVAGYEKLKKIGVRQQIKNKKKYILLKLTGDGSGYIISSHSYYLYSFVCNFLSTRQDKLSDEYEKGKTITPAYDWHRTSYDFFLTQEGRIQKGLDRGNYIKELARLGFTHVEVNGLAFPMGLETGPKGETYPMFYTYCPALDQFVYSELNKGLYPFYYLSANMNYLKENVEYVSKYGLVPGMLCFEPRNVPEEFFQKYPMLRGARVDHPFRSFKPRYNMTITHPKVLDHYAEMVKKIMNEIPDMGFLNIWTNDSGAGFEHTKSLYVGRNGGPYLIREWKNDDEISKLAGENALRFLNVLKDAGSGINPEFRVITRMESFYGEHDTIWEGLRNHVEIETISLVQKGWDMPYTHPAYKDINQINGGSVYQQQFDPEERRKIGQLKRKNADPHFYFAYGPNSMFAPLIGVPYPELTYKRLKTLNENSVDHLAHHCGTLPPDLVPFNINHEVMRKYQYEPELNIKKTVRELTKKWTGEEYYKDLIKAWGLVEKAILAFPNITPLYSSLGFAWYRLWVRPFVPNLDAVNSDMRKLYEEQMCTTPHNPNNVDLSRDVLFYLTTPEKSAKDVLRIDKNLWKHIDNAKDILEKIVKDANKELGKNNIINDQLIRIKALRCWFMTQRNIAAWVSGVYGYMNSKKDKNKHRNDLKKMMKMEIENSREVLKLFRSGIEFMAITDQGETPLMYGTNITDLIKIRIKLMQKHMNDTPYIDHDYIMKKAGEPVF